MALNHTVSFRDGDVINSAELQAFLGPNAAPVWPDAPQDPEGVWDFSLVHGRTEGSDTPSFGLPWAKASMFLKKRPCAVVLEDDIPPIGNLWGENPDKSTVVMLRLNLNSQNPSLTMKLSIEVDQVKHKLAAHVFPSDMVDESEQGLQHINFRHFVDKIQIKNDLAGRTNSGWLKALAEKDSLMAITMKLKSIDIVSQLSIAEIQKFATHNAGFDLVRRLSKGNLTISLYQTTVKNSSVDDRPSTKDLIMNAVLLYTATLFTLVARFGPFWYYFLSLPKALQQELPLNGPANLRHHACAPPPWMVINYRIIDTATRTTEPNVWNHLREIVILDGHRTGHLDYLQSLAGQHIWRD